MALQTPAHGPMATSSVRASKPGAMVMIMPRAILARGIQVADKARKRRNPFRRIKIGRDFCLPRCRRLQNAVTYVVVSSLFYRLGALPCGLFNGLSVC